MTDRLKIFRMLMPAEFVLFDYNPEVLKVKREQTGGAPSKPSGADKKSKGPGLIAGTLGAVFHGTDPLVITISKARIVGPECKVMVETLLGWMSPVSGLLGAAVNAVLSKCKLEASRPPDLIVQWGPPTVGFTITATLIKAEVSYIRVSDIGVPLHAVCELTLKESPSPLSLTNPTSGGRPGRNRHVVHADESLMSIATEAFGNPGAWRAIAEVNGVDDPRAIRPGDVLYLPAPDELNELRERVAMSIFEPVETGTVKATVRIKKGAWLPLNDMVEPLLVRTVVDTSLLRPDMFELTFYDREGTALDLAGITIGTEIEVAVDATKPMMSGEVTSIEGDYDHLVHYTVVRGYDQTHRLQRARRSRTFESVTDGDIAKRVAKEAGLTVGTVEDPRVTHRYVAQVAQTDWEFLNGRAVEIGYETGVADGRFFFRPAPGMSAGGAGGVAGAVASATGIGGPPTLRFGENLRWLRPRISSAGLTAEAEVRVWDADGGAVVSGRAPLESATASLDDDPASLAKAYGTPGMPAIPQIPFLPSFLGASDDAFVVVDRPLGWGSDAQSAADAVAVGMAEHVASTFAEAEGSCMATPGVVAGAKVVFENVPGPFAGEWYVTTARHVLDNGEGYDVRFEVSGRHDRSLRGLMAGGSATSRGRSMLGGLVPGIVSDNIDDQGRYRVRVALPWLSSDFVTDWARVILPGLGEAQGLVMMPEIGDEVVVGFEFGDVRRAYVLGGVATSETASGLDLGGDVITKGIPGGKVVRRGLVSREGHKVLIDDDAAPPNRNASGITIGNADDTVSVHLDDLAKELSIVCDATTPPAKIVIRQNGSGGGIVIEQAGSGGTIDIKSAGSITIEASGTGSLTLKGNGVKIDGGTGDVVLSGAKVKLN